MYYQPPSGPPPPPGWGGYPPNQPWTSPPPGQPYQASPYLPPPGPPPPGPYPRLTPSPNAYVNYPSPAPSYHQGYHTSPGPPPPGSPYHTPPPGHVRPWSQPPTPKLPPRPPQGDQSFGHGAPSNYHFQYSTCTGRRRALLIGINYIGQPNQLRGCINDVANMARFLHESHGYRREDMVILTDDQKNPMSIPTKANILRAMQWLVSDAQPNDALFIHFSGHGGRTPDLDGDEEDGYDDVIYPLDYRAVGHIVDDEMHDILVRPLRPGVRLTAVFDSCHSGTALDLPYVYSTQGILKEPNLAKEAALDLFSAINAYSKGDIGSIATTAIGFFKKATRGDSARQRTVMAKTSPADVVMFSGSKDTQTSADTFQDGEARGALSWAFIKSLRKNPYQSYLQLLNNIRAELEGRYSQKPQLSCSHPLDVNLRFVM